MRLIAAFVAFLCLLTPAWAAPNFPALTGRVVDGANLLGAGARADLDQKLAALEAKTSRQLVVVTLPSLQGYEISDYGYQLGRAWGIGQGKLNNGALFIIAPGERKVRIEVGYGLEPILTDAFSSVIIQSQVLPRFRQRDFEGGIRAGTDALIAQLSLERSEAEARAAAAAQQRGGQQQDLPGWLVILIFLGIFGVIVLMSASDGGGGRGGRGFGGGYGGGYYGGGGGRGGWGGGGGFGGGGGSFGGGGSSGSW